MKKSVALCTYMGADYIVYQLLSILNQTSPVDEIIICDDASSKAKAKSPTNHSGVSGDSTVQLIRQIAARSKVEIKLFVNDFNLGCLRNFEKAISLCSGDIIFLADQDDIWMPDKVEVIVNYFNAHPEKEAVFTNAILINQSGGATYDKTLFDIVGIDDRCKMLIDRGRGLEVFSTSCRATGATMALRSSLIPYCLPFPVVLRMMHDEIIAIAALLRNSLGYVDKSLIKYRLHKKQTLGLNHAIINPPRPWELEKQVMMWHLALPEPQNTHHIAQMHFVYKRFWVLRSSFSMFRFLNMYFSGQYAEFYLEPGRVFLQDIKSVFIRFEGKIVRLLSGEKSMDTIGG